MTTDEEKLLKYWKEAGNLMVFNEVGITTGHVIDILNGFIVMKVFTGERVWINVESISQIREALVCKDPQ